MAYISELETLVPLQLEELRSNRLELRSWCYVLCGWRW
jgi:hypothetical protein